MSKKKKALIIGIVIFVLGLLIPLPSGTLKDGGTRYYTSLTYRYVRWHFITDEGDIHAARRVYFFPNNFRSIDSLYNQEKKQLPLSILGKVKEVNGSEIIIDDTDSGRFSFSIAELPEQTPPEVGDYIRVYFEGEIAEVYPAILKEPLEWRKETNLRNLKFEDQWLQKPIAVSDKPQDFFVTAVFENCFFASTVIPMPNEYKFNGILPDSYTVGDKVHCEYSNLRMEDSESFPQKFEADIVSITPSDFETEELVAYKPVIYLYPEQKTEVSVRLKLNGELSCTYPRYQDGWLMTAEPDGTLTNSKGLEYNYLYWEGRLNTEFDFSQGFCVKGEDTAGFLESALASLGLNRREANEFIIFWLPLMQDNPYNIISFQSESYTSAAELEISPSPTSLIRVFMAFKASDRAIDIEEQELSSPERSGFVAVEWGGTEVK